MFKKLGCGCGTLIGLAVVAIVAVALMSPPTVPPIALPNRAADNADSQPPAASPPAMPIKPPKIAQAREPASVIVDPPDIDVLRNAYSEAIARLKELDALAKRPANDQFVRVAKVQRQLPDAMAEFDRLMRSATVESAEDIRTVAEGLLRWHSYTIPTDSSPSERTQARQHAEQDYLATLSAAKEWSKGEQNKTRTNFADQAESMVESKMQSIRLYAFMASLNALGVDSSIITEVQLDGETVTVQVSQPWHLMQYQLRLQAAQGLYELSKVFVSNPRLILVDVRGNRVGGSSSLSRSTIDVDR